MKKAPLLLIILVLSAVLMPLVRAESSSPWWVKSYGENNGDVIHNVKVLEDGSIIAVGWSNSSGAGNQDFLIIKLSSKGTVIWQKTYGGKDNDWANAVAIAPNGDIIVAGWTESFGAGNKDVLVFRLDKNGNVIWQRTYGGKHWDKAFTTSITHYGDIIIAGDTKSFGAGGFDSWILRLPSDGSTSWLKSAFGFSSKNPDAKVEDSNAVVKTPSAVVKDTDAIAKTSNANISSVSLVVETQYPSYQKPLVIGAILGVATAGGSGYAIRRKRRCEHKIKHAREMLTKAENAPPD